MYVYGANTKNEFTHCVIVLETLARKRFNYMYTTCHHVRDGQIYQVFVEKQLRR